ncbi:MAG TPA: lipopolysaccharide heptosyltransferase II [Gemmatimonadales bacterium]|nr:lipopolysaccharide heptosyltransferase II [Gemmatimonadales bacterium]
MADAALVIQTAFLGDVVLTTPLLAALSQRYSAVDVVTTPAALPLLETHPAVRHAVAYDKRGQDRGVAGLVRIARTLRAARYDIAYLPHRSLRTALLARLAGVPQRVGFADGWRLLYTETRQRPREAHEVDRLLALIGAPSGAFAPRLYPTAEDQCIVDEMLRAGGIGTACVALAPGSIWGTKRWPYFGELATELAQQSAIAVVGGPDDAELGDAIHDAVTRSGGRAVNACGKLTVRQSAALLGRARLLVTNDSAPQHLATAVGTPVVALFGPTVVEFGFGPIRAGDVALGVAGLACRPCSAHGPRVCPLGHHRCMKDLSVASVLQAVEEVDALRRRD